MSYADFITLLFAFFVVMFASTQDNKIGAKAVSESVKDALEHGQFSNTLSTVLGRGKHENSKPPQQSATGQAIREPAAADRAPAAAATARRFDEVVGHPPARFG